MEVHVQPRTRSKMFCGCAIGELGDAPNTHVCEVCLGLPGVLPVPNKAAVEACLKSALALGCEIPRHTKFDRKNYMYPDLPKGYQISQYDLPMSINGHLDVGGGKVRIRRVHLEEDTGKLIHAGDKLHEAGDTVVQETRGWSEAEQRTFSQRSKEFAEDYRYFPEPDIPPLELDRAWIEDLRRGLPELPAVRRARLVADHSLPHRDVAVIGADRELAGLFDGGVAARAPAKQVADWIVAEGAPNGKLPSAPKPAALVKLVSERGITRDQAREGLVESGETGRTPAEIAAEHGHKQGSDESELRVLAEAVIDANPRAAADYRGGKKQAMQALMADLRKRAPPTKPQSAHELPPKLARLA